jgi:hypothetical protein
MTSPGIPPDVVAVLPQTFLARVPAELAREILSAGYRTQVPPAGMLRHSRAEPGLCLVVEGLVRVFMRSTLDRQ